jgi:hypothetical protein
MTATVTPTRLPRLQGGSPNTLYRLYTVEELPWDAVPTYAEGGPACAVIGGWHVAYQQEGGEPIWQLLCRKLSMRYDSIGQIAERHPLHGTHYPTLQDAQRAAYEGGALARMVYERDAARFGLPTSQEV